MMRASRRLLYGETGRTECSSDFGPFFHTKSRRFDDVSAPESCTVRVHAGRGGEMQNLLFV